MSTRRRSTESTSTTDLAADERWPELLTKIPEAGVRSVLGIPVRSSGLAVGALNVYRDHVHEWNDGEIAVPSSYRKVLEGLLRAALQARDRDELAEQLQNALNSRVVIERAVGVIMGKQGFDAVTAFNQLRDSARRSRRKVADVAAELLNR